MSYYTSSWLLLFLSFSVNLIMHLWIHSYWGVIKLINLLCAVAYNMKLLFEIRLWTNSLILWKLDHCVFTFKSLGELVQKEPYQKITDNQYCLLHISTDLPFRDLLVKCIFICMFTYFSSCEIYKGNGSIDYLIEVVTAQQKMTSWRFIQH